MEGISRGTVGVLIILAMWAGVGVYHTFQMAGFIGSITPAVPIDELDPYSPGGIPLKPRKR